MHHDPATLNALLKRLGLSSVQRLLPETLIIGVTNRGFVINPSLASFTDAGVPLQLY